MRYSVRSTFCRSQFVMEAVTAFRQAESPARLWDELHRRMARYGIAGMMYGAESFGGTGRQPDILLNSYDPAYVEAKMAGNMLECDTYVLHPRQNPTPALWSDESLVQNLSPESARSLEIDWEFGVITGVTLPMRFNNGIGVSALSLHAAGMSFDEFDRIWLDHQNDICAIASAFDVCLRNRHAPVLIGLTSRERECLLWTAAGLSAKEIANRFGTHYKTVEKQLGSAMEKLNATSKTQSVATALVFGLITP